MGILIGNLLVGQLFLFPTPKSLLFYFLLGLAFCLYLQYFFSYSSLSYTMASFHLVHLFVNAVNLVMLGQIHVFRLPNECLTYALWFLFSISYQGAVASGIGNIFSKLITEIGDPVDFELPDWLNKWQPMPYTFIKRSILVKL